MTTIAEHVKHYDIDFTNEDQTLKEGDAVIIISKDMEIRFMTVGEVDPNLTPEEAPANVQAALSAVGILRNFESLPHFEQEEDQNVTVTPIESLEDALIYTGNT